jgi:hypothetical protein
MIDINEEMGVDIVTTIMYFLYTDSFINNTLLASLLMISYLIEEHFDIEIYDFVLSAITLIATTFWIWDSVPRIIRFI